MSKLNIRWIAPIINYITLHYDFDDMLNDAASVVYDTKDKLLYLDDLRNTLTVEEYYEELKKILKVHISVEWQQELNQ